MITEKISEHLGKPYIYLKDKKKFLCQNGVLFTLEEYKNGIDINAEYERRAKEDKLYDYVYAKNTGILRKKRSKAVQQTGDEVPEQKKQEVLQEAQASDDSKNVSEWHTGNDVNELIQGKVSSSCGVAERTQTERREDSPSRRVYSGTDKSKADRKSGTTAVGFIIALLAFTSVISGYISTLQTATYLYDYVDVISSWLMSASVTAYNVTAFEVAVLFKQNRRYGLTFIFITLWVTVTVFSMATAVSVFYDRFNFNETTVAEENKSVDSNKLALELLRTKEKDLRDAIEFKKKDIEYRQEKDYATATVRSELVKLEADLQANLTEQQELLKETPEVTQEVVKKKERLFAFLGRMLNIDSGVFEFGMSTLSAIFVNIISPMSLVAVAELNKRRRNMYV